MPLRENEQFIKDIVKHIEDNADKIEFNNKLFEISEGDLAKYVEKSIREQLRGKTANVAVDVLVPL